MRKIDPERIERAARIYASNQEASEALGIAPGSFSRLCRLYGIETPYARRRRRRLEFRRRREARKLLARCLADGVPQGVDPDDLLLSVGELEGVL